MAQFVQVVAEQLHGGNYVHLVTEYFSDPDAIKDWLSGAVEWADRFKIFDTREWGSNFFYEGLVVNGTIPKWEKKSLINSKILDVYA